MEGYRDIDIIKTWTLQGTLNFTRYFFKEKFKRKFEKTGIVKELRARQQFDKPSVKNRLKMERAIYVQQLQRVED